LVRLIPYLIPQPQGARKRKATAIDGDRRSSDLDPAATQEPPSKFQTIASVEISSTSMMMRWMKLLIRPLPNQHTGEPHPHLNFRMSPKSGLISPQTVTKTTDSELEVRTPGHALAARKGISPHWLSGRTKKPGGLQLVHRTILPVYVQVPRRG
jgi:hypothetical protein